MKHTILAVAVGLVGIAVAWYVFWPRHEVWFCDASVGACSKMVLSTWRMFRPRHNDPRLHFKTKEFCQLATHCSPAPAPPSPEPEPQIVEETNVSYGPAPIHVMDTYRLQRQPSAAAATPRRALVLVHGGGMVKGGKGEAREVSIAREMAQVGFDVFVPSYTLGANSWPQNLSDVTLAVQFVKSMVVPYAYASVVLMGLSAGATLALLCGIARPELVSAVISMYGITSPADRTYTDAPDTFRPGHIHTVVGTSRCVSCRSQDTKHHRDARCAGNRNANCLADVWLDVSPVEQLARQSRLAWGLPRFVLVHGDKDGIVNPNQAGLFAEAHAEAITHAGGLEPGRSTVHVIRIPNGQHGFNLRKNRDGTLLEIEDLRRSILEALL